MSPEQYCCYSSNLWKCIQKLLATYTQADAVPTSAPSVGAVGNFGSMTSNASLVLLVIWQVLLELLAMTLTAGESRYNCY